MGAGGGAPLPPHPLFANVVDIRVNIFSLSSLTTGASFLLTNCISLFSRSSTTFVINIVPITVELLSH